MSAAGPALVAGELRGYRRFRVATDGGLHSPVRGGAAWHPGLEHAACPSGHGAPITGCGCGLHAWYHPGDAVGAGDVLASVLLRGTTVLGDHGMRAAAARVEAVAVRDPRTRDAIAARYPGVAVLASTRQLIRTHPPQPVDSLGVSATLSPTSRYRRAFLLLWGLGVALFYGAVLLAATTGLGDPALLLAAVVLGQVLLGWLVARSLRDPASTSGRKDARVTRSGSTEGMTTMTWEVIDCVASSLQRGPRGRRASRRPRERRTA